MFGDPAEMTGGANRALLQLAQTDLDCALKDSDEKLGEGFGAKMHWYT